MKTQKFIPVFLASLIVFLTASPTWAAQANVKERLMKCVADPAVYLVSSNKTAKVFPDEQTLASYGYRFDQVTTELCEKGFPYKLKGEVPNKQGIGFRLMKRTNESTVFACEAKSSYQECTKINNPQEAESRFGANWPEQVYETDARSLDPLIRHYQKISLNK